MKKRIALCATVVFLLDISSKYFCNILLKAQILDFSPFFILSCRNNSGIALGVFSKVPVLSYLLPPLGILCACYVLYPFFDKVTIQVAFGMLAGGFSGNWLNRLITGTVLDMLFFPWLPWFVCNIADIAITVGVCLIFFSLVFSKDIRLSRKEETDHAGSVDRS